MFSTVIVQFESAEGDSSTEDYRLISDAMNHLNQYGVLMLKSEGGLPEDSKPSVLEFIVEKTGSRAVKMTPKKEIDINNLTVSIRPDLLEGLDDPTAITSVSPREYGISFRLSNVGTHGTITYTLMYHPKQG